MHNLEVGRRNVNDGVVEEVLTRALLEGDFETMSPATGRSVAVSAARTCLSRSRIRLI